MEEIIKPSKKFRNTASSITASVGSDFKRGKKTSTSTQNQTCLSPLLFERDKYSELWIRLEYLKSFDTENEANPGDYVIRVINMGEIFGHYDSGTVDSSSIQYYTTTDMITRRSFDVQLRNEIEFCIKFTDLVDNPIIFQLCYGADIPREAYPNLQPIGYINLDAAAILEYKAGVTSRHKEPWIIPNKRNPPIIIHETPIPSLQLSVRCATGIPEVFQGNVMTVFCETLHNMPTIVQQNISYSDNHSDVQVYMTLPHSQTDPVLKFSAGKLRENYAFDQPFHNVTTTEDSAQTGDIRLDGAGPALMNPSTSHEASRVGQSQPDGKAPKFWASIREQMPDIPLEGAAMNNEITSMDVHDDVPNADGYLAEVYGDGREDYMEFSETQEPRIVWNSFHRRYISVTTYRQMLSRLTQNTMWPIEVCVAVKRKPTTDASKKKKPAHNQVNLVELAGSTSTESNDKMIMSELGYHPPSTTEFILVYHGIAFVDLSCLFQPGLKSARFACRVYPYSNELLAKRTCVALSALPEPLRQSLLIRQNTEHKKRTKGVIGGNVRPSQISVSVNENSGNNIAQGMNQIPGLNTQYNNMLQPQPQGGKKQNSSDESNYNYNIYKQFVSKQKASQRSSDDFPAINIADLSNGGHIIERTPFLVFRVSTLRAIVPYYRGSQYRKVNEDITIQKQQQPCAIQTKTGQRKLKS